MDESASASGASTNVSTPTGTHGQFAAVHVQQYARTEHHDQRVIFLVASTCRVLLYVQAAWPRGMVRASHVPCGALSTCGGRRERKLLWPPLNSHTIARQRCSMTVVLAGRSTVTVFREDVALHTNWSQMTTKASARVREPLPFGWPGPVWCWQLVPHNGLQSRAFAPVHVFGV